MVRTTPRPLNPRERPGTHSTRRWLASRAGLDGRGKSRPRRYSTPGPTSPYQIAVNEWVPRAFVLEGQHSLDLLWSHSSGTTRGYPLSHCTNLTTRAYMVFSLTRHYPVIFCRKCGNQLKAEIRLAVLPRGPDFETDTLEIRSRKLRMHGLKAITTTDIYYNHDTECLQKLIRVVAVT